MSALKSRRFFVGLAVASILTGLLSSCTTDKKSSDSGQAAASKKARSIASENDPDRGLEIKYQVIMSDQHPDMDMIDYVITLDMLLKTASEDIAKFDAELDRQLVAKSRRSSSYKQFEITQSKDYLELLHIWPLRDQYITDISYLYFRLLETQLQPYDPSNTVSADTATKVRENLSSAITSLVNKDDWEFKELRARLDLIKLTFLQMYPGGKANFNAASILAYADGQEPESFVNFEEAMETPESIRKFVAARSLRPEIRRFMPTEEDDVAMDHFKSKLQTINSHGPIFQLAEPGTEREPNSVQPTGVCSNGHKLCPSPLENGNFSGFTLPKRTWVFTFDDGPAAKSTGDMLELIHGYSDKVNPKGKATFFQLAKNVNLSPNNVWVKKAFEYGFPVEDHSFTHPDLTQASVNLQHEVNEANAVLTAAYQKINPAYKIEYFRCPYGACYAPKSPKVRQMITDLNEIHVYWRIDSLDWKLLDGPKVAALVEKQILLLDHGVILMHDIHPTTVDAMRLVLTWLKDQNDNHGANIKMVTVPEGINLVNGITKN